jgi:large subunit ribosomal protein L4
MKLIVRNAAGTPTKQMEVDDSVFGIEPNMPVLHQAFVTGRNNQRAGTAQTKTRGMVQGSTKKVRRQKYTGRSRQGSNRAPHRVGGGVAFGPVQRSYAQALPKKMKRLAIRSALSGKAADGQLVVIDELSFDAPKTKQLMGILRAVGIERSALVVTAQTDRAILASLRNLPKTKTLPAAYLNVVDMMNHQSILMTEEAVRIAEQLWAVKTLKPKATAKAVEKKAAPAKKRPAAKAKAVEAEAVEAEVAVEVAVAAKPKRAPAKAEAAPKAKAAKAKTVTPKAKAEADAKPARAARKPKAEASADVEKKPAPRKRAPKKTEGEG